MVGGLLSAVVCGVVMLLSVPSALFGRVPPPDGLVAADAPLVAVIDGQTLRLRESVIRLQGVVAPSRGQVCRMSDASSSDGPTFDCGAAATEALARLVRGHAVACHLDGRDAAGFPEARCESGGTDLNRGMVASGWGRADPGAADLIADEAAARGRHAGLWRLGASGLPQ